MGQRWQETKVLMSAQSIDPGSTAYSTAIGAFNVFSGGDDFGLPILLQVAAGVTGAFTISQQCSVDGANFFDPTNATAIAQGVVMTGRMTATATWLIYTSLNAPYLRYKVVSTPAATVTLSAIISGDRA